MKSLYPSSNRVLLPAVAAAAFCHGSPAWAVNVSDGNGHVDVLPYSTGTGIEAGHYDFDVDQVIEDTRLFVREMNLVSEPTLFGATNPGFTTYTPPDGSVSYTLPANEDLNFNVPIIRGSDEVERNVLYWDGEGTPEFGALMPGEDFFLRLSSRVNTTLDGSSVPATGFNIQTTAPDGTMHRHFTFMARSNDPGLSPSDGFYLFAMQFVVDGFDDSDPIYLLFNADYERDGQGQMLFNVDRPIVNKTTEQLATDWVLDNLLAEALPADLDLDGDVDDADFGLFFAAFTGPGVGPPSNPAADLDSDNDVDDADFGLAFAAFTGPGGASAVPEPGSLLALLAGTGLLVARRR